MLGRRKRVESSLSRPYDLRHIWAICVAEAGIDLVILAAMTGRSRIQMVMRYAHPTQGHEPSAMKKLVQHSVKQEKAERAAELRKASDCIVFEPPAEVSVATPSILLQRIGRFGLVWSLAFAAF